MNLNGINIYTENGEVISFMKNSLRSGICNFHSPDEKPGSDSAHNVFIASEIPGEIHENAKYILLTDTPGSLDFDQIKFLYDIWPLTLTQPLLKFFTGRLIGQIKSEIQQAHTERSLIEIAHHDYLTGLATRWYLHEYFHNNGDEENLTCIYFDLDNFKEVNDTYGHQTGDRVLASTAGIIHRAFSDGFAARMGGDEFMVVLTGGLAAHEVESRVMDLMDKLADYYANIPTMKNLSVSAGIAQRLNGENKSIDTLINESDTALYDAKKAGKNCCRIYNK